MAMKARFVGQGDEFVNGVPARALTEAEFAALTPEQQGAVLATRDAQGRLLYAVQAKAEALAELAQAITAAPELETPSSAPRGAKRGGA